MKIYYLAGVAAAVLFLSACKQPPAAERPVLAETPIAQPEGGESPVPVDLQLTSSAFTDNGQIPQKYTCDGENVNPPLAISNLPEWIQSLVLIVDDPDVPIEVWDHWLVWNISPETVVVEENSVPIGAVQGVNSFGDSAWGGPCPPLGSAHHYVFRLYALDVKLDLAPGATRAEVEPLMTGHILAKTQITGLYER